MKTHVPLQPCTNNTLLREWSAPPLSTRKAFQTLFDAKVSIDERTGLISAMVFTRRDEELLIRLACGRKKAEQPLQIRACRALAEVGSETALSSMQKLAVQPGALGAAAKLAHVVISHRAGKLSECLVLPRPEELLMPSGRISSLRVEPAEDSSLVIRCGGETLRYENSVPARDERTSAAIRRTPQLVGRILMQSDFSPEWPLHAYVVSGPLTERTSYYSVIHGTGRLWLSGEIRTGDMSVDLHAIRQPGARGTTVHVHWMRDAVSLTGFVGSDRIARKEALLIPKTGFKRRNKHRQ